MTRSHTRAKARFQPPIAKGKGRTRCLPGQAHQDSIGLAGCLLRKAECQSERGIENKGQGRPSLIRSVIRSFPFPGGFRTLREAFIRAMTSCISWRLVLLAGTSLAVSSPCRLMEKLSPPRTRSKSSENFVFASDAAIVVAEFILFGIRPVEGQSNTAGLMRKLPDLP